MMYWIILTVLAVLILVTIIVTIVTIVKEKKEYRKYELEEEYDIEDDYEDRRPKKCRKSGSRPELTDDSDDYEDSAGSPPNRRRWKIILEDTDTDQRYTYIFYNNVGIGRTTKEVAFEEFLSIPGDRKVSKVHCAIIQRKDKLYLRDEGSKNHTFLNGKKIQKPIILQKEDFISLGETELEVIKILRETN
ncbi:MAG: FHA domain-containing protein [Muricomes sp.]